MLINKLPFTFLDIGPHRWKIVMSKRGLEEIEEELDTDLWGVTDWANFTITIRSGVPDTKAKETILHELTHVIYGTYPHDNKEESIALIMGLGLTSILKQNKRFAQWLIT